ncbi:hypothetical protein FIM04_04130 [SAR202 cluster bacterium AC-409-J13_OGT_754m]|nr:hypothetical protein [SAR202 cluster bacterium AC-409-J13_OGT_754m]
MCLIAAGLVVLASFVVVGIFARNENIYVRYPQLNLSISKLTIPICLITSVSQIISVFIFFVIIFAGFFGSSNPVYNIAPTMVWVIWWVGIAYVSAFVGDIWSILNPWKILFEWVEKLVQQLNISLPLGPIAKYPSDFGIWPALMLLLIFAWIENVYPDAILPLRISQMILIYSGITWIGMIIFGKNVWLRNGEAFSLVFGFLAKFSPLEMRSRSIGSHSADVLGEPLRSEHDRSEQCDTSSNTDVSDIREVIVRPFGTGLLNVGSGSTTHMYFVLVLLASVTFDGFTATVPWMDIQTLLLEKLASPTLINTLGLLATVMIFMSTYLFFCLLMRLVSNTNVTAMDLANRFVYTLIPIALAYHVAHFLVFLLIQGQLIIPLASDPFGFGWDIFGSENYRLNFNIVAPTFYWATSVVAIVIGHIIAVFLAHSIALRLGKTRGEAVRSQFPMLVLMVGYTVASLWIITQPMYISNM